MNMLRATLGSRWPLETLTTRLLLAAVLAAGTAGAGVATALTINVDMGDGPLYAGTADAPDSGTVWNLYAVPGVPVALVDSQGNATTVVFQTGAEPLPPNPLGAEIITWTISATNDLQGDLLALSTNGSPVAWQLSGLAPNAAYDLYAYGLLLVGAAYLVESAAGGPLGSVRIHAISDPSGTIAGTFCYPCGLVANAGAQGLQIHQSVPEPTLSLLVLPVLGIWLQRTSARRRWAPTRCSL